MRADTHAGPEQNAPLQRPNTLLQLSRSSILERHLAPHGRAIHFGTKRTWALPFPYAPSSSAASEGHRWVFEPGAEARSGFVPAKLPIHEDDPVHQESIQLGPLTF